MRFLWLGKFQSDAPDWTHPARELGEYELMIVDHGTLYIADHSQTHTVHKGEYLIMPPTTLQHGTKPSSCGFHISKLLILFPAHLPEPSLIRN